MGEEVQCSCKGKGGSMLWLLGTRRECIVVMRDERRGRVVVRDGEGVHCGYYR